MRTPIFFALAVASATACGSRDDADRHTLRADDSTGDEHAALAPPPRSSEDDPYVNLTRAADPGPVDPTVTTAGANDPPDVAPEIADPPAVVEAQGTRPAPATSESAARAQAPGHEESEASTDPAREGAPMVAPRQVAANRLIAEPVQRGDECVIGRDRRFSCAQRFTIANVPAGVRFYRVGDHDWEAIDRGGRRVALISETDYAAPSEAGTASAVTAARRPAMRTVSVPAWGGARARVVLEEFGDEISAYRIERRDAGSEWIGRGWGSAAVEAELATPDNDERREAADRATTEATR